MVNRFRLIISRKWLVYNNLKDKIGSNQAGEGGEFESLVLDCPLFKKKLQIIDSDILQDSEYSARLIVKKAELVDK